MKESEKPVMPPMFRFTIRDVLWLTVVVALAVEWWVDRSRVHARLINEVEWRSTLQPVDTWAPGNSVWLEPAPKSDPVTPNRR